MVNVLILKLQKSYLENNLIDFETSITGSEKGK